MGKTFITVGTGFAPTAPNDTPPWEVDPGEVNVEPAPKAVEDDYTMGEFWAEVKPAM